ncbi:hypothetical protein ACHAW5_007206 [Stephanodiscus triporus]|uniref:Uncharacterized protein n=1 Tax=Stephanodiscus triporus TaxID=2934178 RepID=A0ABD3MF91_9STRA
MLHLEESFKDEQTFIEKFARGDAKDVVVLHVSGTIMVTTRSTFGLNKDAKPRVMEWTPDQAGDWAKNVEGIQEDVSSILRENRITGRELLSLNLDG